MYLPPLRKVLPLLCATFMAIPAATFAGEMMKFTKQNFAISLPETWEDVTDANPSKGLVAFFLAPDRKRMVLVFRDDKVPPPEGLDERFIEEYEKNIGVTGGNKRLTGKIVVVQGVKSYERTGEGEWRGNTISTWSRTIPVGDHFYMLRGMIWNGGKADQDPQIFESMDSFHFLTTPPARESQKEANPATAVITKPAPVATPAPAPAATTAAAVPAAPAAEAAAPAAPAVMPAPAATASPAPLPVVKPALEPSAPPVPAPEAAVPPAGAAKPAEVTPAVPQAEEAPAPLSVPNTRLSVKPKLPAPPAEAAPDRATEQKPEPAATKPSVEIDPMLIYGGIGALGVSVIGLAIWIALRRKPAVVEEDDDEDLDDLPEDMPNIVLPGPKSAAVAPPKSSRRAPAPFAPSFADSRVTPKNGVAPVRPPPPPTLLPKQPVAPKQALPMAKSQLPAPPKDAQSTQIPPAAPKAPPIQEPARSILRPPPPKAARAQVNLPAPRPRLPIAPPKQSQPPSQAPLERTVWEEPEEKNETPAITPAAASVPTAKAEPAPTVQAATPAPVVLPPRLPLTPPETSRPQVPIAPTPAAPASPAPPPALQRRGGQPQAAPRSLVPPPPPKMVVPRAPSAPPPPGAVPPRAPLPPAPAQSPQPKPAPQQNAEPQFVDVQPTVIRPPSPKPATPQAPPPPAPTPASALPPKPEPKAEPQPAAPPSSKAMLLRPRQNTRIRGD